MENHKRETQLITAQLICFGIATVFGFSADLFNEHSRHIIYKFADAMLITGTILLAMKFARDGWDMPAAGFTLLSIAWGVFFLAKDFHEQEVGEDIFSSAFYFLLPSMILITFYKPFPLLIKVISLITIIPSFIALFAVQTGISEESYSIWRKINYQSIHIASLFWGVFLFNQFRKEKSVSVSNKIPITKPKRKK